MTTVVTELVRSRELLVNLTLRELRGKYKRTTLGHLWSLINPISIMLIYTVLFGILLKFTPPAGHNGIKNYPMFLLCALLPWTYLTNMMTGGMESLVENANLVKKVYFPRVVLVSATALSWTITFGIEMLVLTAVLLIFGFMPLSMLPLAIVFIGLLTVFGLGIAYALSVANVYFRDTKHFMNIFVQLWFYATPIIYPLSMVFPVSDDGVQSHPTLLFFYKLNPMERFAEVFRDCFYMNQMPDWSDMVFCAAAAVVSILVGYWLFKRFEGRLAEEL